MLLGAHVPSSDPSAETSSRGGDTAAIFLSSPQMWRAPKPKSDAWVEKLAGLPLYVHAPYLINPASATEATRTKSAALLAATLEEADRVGARGVVVHAGSYGTKASLQEGVDRWVELLAGISATTPVLVENVAKGNTSLGRDAAQVDALMSGLRSADLDVPVGFCLDTNHLWEGVEWSDLTPATGRRLVEEMADAAGGVDLLHINSSKHPAGAGRDHHDNIATGTIPADTLLEMVVAASAPAGVVETPNGLEAQAADVAWLRENLPS